MRHAFIDNYAELDTPIHRFSPRLKLLFLAIFLLLVVSTSVKYIQLFLFYSILIVWFVFLSKIPIRFILKRLLELIPFMVVISFASLFRENGMALFFVLFIKSILALLLVLTVSSTTKFTQLIEALRQMKVPGIFISLLSFMYRYSFLLEDQLLRAHRAYKSRSIDKGNNFGKFKVLSFVLGTLFIRTYERAERVYLAMCARGYNGE